MPLSKIGSGLKTHWPKCTLAVAVAVTCWHWHRRMTLPLSVVFGRSNRRLWLFFGAFGGFFDAFEVFFELFGAFSSFLRFFMYETLRFWMKTGRFDCAFIFRMLNFFDDLSLFFFFFFFSHLGLIFHFFFRCFFHCLSLIFGAFSMLFLLFPTIFFQLSPQVHRRNRALQFSASPSL
jgi:hypothetical protein